MGAGQGFIILLYQGPGLLGLVGLYGGSSGGGGRGWRPFSAGFS